MPGLGPSVPTQLSSTLNPKDDDFATPGKSTEKKQSSVAHEPDGDGQKPNVPSAVLFLSSPGQKSGG